MQVGCFLAKIPRFPSRRISRIEHARWQARGADRPARGVQGVPPREARQGLRLGARRALAEEI